MNKKLLVLLILIAILGTGIVIMYRNKISPARDVSAAVTESVQEQKNPGVVCVSYAGTYLTLDKDGVICANTSAKPAHIPEMTGVRFERMIYGKAAQPEDASELNYVIRVAGDLQKHGIEAGSINYENRMITVNVDNLKIKLGKDDNTDEKINDLKNLYEMVRGLRGTLYMQNGNENNYGYSFRAADES